MTKQIALLVILGISIIGILFSGFLSYKELFTGSCNLAFVRCGTTGGLLFNLPACVYGFFMYTVVLVVSVFGLKSSAKQNE